MPVNQGNQKKLSGWFSEYGKRLLGFVKSKINDWEEAEDITQEVWYQLSNQKDLGEIDQIGNWLFTAANNRIKNFYKKKKSTPFSVLEKAGGAAESSSDLEETESFQDWIEESLPSDLIERKEFWEVLQKLLSDLPPEQREVFVENELNEISFRELSEKTGLSINTLLSRKSYAVKKLKKEFTKIFTL